MAYIADETLVAEMKQNKKLMHRFNTTQPWEFEKLDEIAHSCFLCAQCFCLHCRPPGTPRRKGHYV